MASLDDLDGATCRVGTPQEGVVRVSYATDGTLSLTCAPSKLFTLTVAWNENLTGTVAASPGGLDCHAQARAPAPTPLAQR